MRRFRVDHIAAAFNFDASETAFTERALLEVRTQLYEVKFPELMAETFLPRERQTLNPGATHFTYQYLTHYGTVALHSGMSQRGPRAEVKKTEATPIMFVSKTNSYGYSMQDIRSAMMAGFNLDGEKSKAARKAIEFWRDDALLLGDGTATYDGLTGLFKLSGTVSHTIANGVAGSKTFASKTPDECVAALHAICNAIVTGSNGVENPDTLILPLTVYTDLSTRRMGDGDSTTILEFFLKVRQKLKPGFQVFSSHKLETAGSGSTTRMVAYERNAEKVARLDVIPFEQMSPQVEAFETITDCHTRTAGVYSAYPKSVAYGDGC